MKDSGEVIFRTCKNKMGQAMCGQEEDENDNNGALLFSPRESQPSSASSNRKSRRISSSSSNSTKNHRVRRLSRLMSGEDNNYGDEALVAEDVMEDDDNDDDDDQDERIIIAGMSAHQFKEIVRLIKINEKEKEVLRATWRVLDVDKIAVGMQFILMLFRTYPDYLSLFQALAALDDESLSGSSALHAHAMTFMHSLAGVVESLDDPECLVAQLKKIADRHKPFGLTEEDFRKATAVFLKVLKTVEGLQGLEYDRKTILAAWSKAIGTIVQVIGKGLPNAESSDE